MVDLSKFEDGMIFSPLQKDLLNTLEKSGPMCRTDLVKKIDSPRTTIYDNLTRLQNHNLVRKFSRPTNSRGRPLVFFKLTRKIKLPRNPRLKIKTINLPEQYVGCLDNLVDLGFFPSRSEAIRQALKQFLNKEDNFVKTISSSVFLNLKVIQMNALIGSK